MTGENLIGSVPASNVPVRTQIIQGSHKYATWQNIRAEVFGGSKGLQMNVNPSQLRLVKALTSNDSVIDFQFGSNISHESYEIGLSSQDAFVVTGVAIKFGVVTTIANLGNETLVQSADATEMGSANAAKAVKAFLQGTHEFSVAGQETIFKQSTDVLDFENFNETPGQYRLGSTMFHELLKTIRFKGSEVNEVSFKANGSIADMPANAYAMLVLDGFIIRRNQTAITRQA